MTLPDQLSLAQRIAQNPSAATAAELAVYACNANVRALDLHVVDPQGETYSLLLVTPGPHRQPLVDALSALVLIPDPNTRRQLFLAALDRLDAVDKETN